MSKLIEMLTIKEVLARTTGLSDHYIRQLIREGKITYIKTGKKYLINWVRFVEFLNTGEKETTKENQDTGHGKIRRIV